MLIEAHTGHTYALFLLEGMALRDTTVARPLIWRLPAPSGCEEKDVIEVSEEGGKFQVVILESENVKYLKR